MDTKITNKKTKKSPFNTLLPFLINNKKKPFSSINMQSCKIQYKKLEILKENSQSLKCIEVKFFS